MRVKTLTVAVLAIMLSGCTAESKAPDAAPTTGAPATQPSPNPSLPPAAVSSALAQVRSGAAVDLGLALALAGDCLMGKDAQGTLWLRVTVAVNWIGTQFPATTYSLTADRGASPVTGTIKSGNPFVASIGGKPADLLGRDVVLTVTVDPGNTVSEFSEANNTLKLTLQVGPNAPGDTADYVVACE